jgi:RNA polymerase primary sigma factor
MTNQAEEAEPTPTELSQEDAFMAAAPPISKKKRPLTDPNQDMLAAYMGQLGNIPLYTAADELEYARQLEVHELRAWTHILHHPKAVACLIEEAEGLLPEIHDALENLRESYRRAAARSFSRELSPSPRRQRLVEHLAGALRRVDYDKERLERVMVHLRHEVWGRRVLSTRAAYRLTHADLTRIEQERGHGMRIRNDFVRANLRLVVSVARHFHQYKINFIDLIQEGNVGLLKAVHRFDHRRGFRFSTYAHWWIRQSIERAIINKGSQVRLPVHIIDARRQVARATTKLTQSLGRSPSTEELSLTTGMPLPKLESLMQGVVEDPVSLDEPVGGNDARKFLDLVRDDQTPALDESLIRENTHEHVRELLHQLNPIEKDIIRRRFGLGTDSDQTLDEIGLMYNLSRERVRQIQAQGLMKMRRMCERRQIH